MLVATVPFECRVAQASTMATRIFDLCRLNKRTDALASKRGALPSSLWRRRMKSLIESIVHALVDQPEEVQIKEVIGDHAHVLELRVAKEDLGKVIGKGGAHASAVRTLMAAASGKEKKRYILEIIED